MPRSRTPLLLLLALALALPASASAQATAFGDRPGTLRLPEAVAVAPDGTVLVGDHFSGRIQRFRAGKVVPDASFGMSGEVCGRLSSVAGLAHAADGRVYVYDSDNQRVQVFGVDGRVERCWGRRGRAPGQFNTSSGNYAASTGEGGIAVDARHVYVADTGNDRIQRFTRDGREAKVLARGKVKQPQGLAVRGGRLLVADDNNHRVVELDPGSGRIVRTTRGGLKFPYDVALAPDGKAYVADNNGHRIVVLDRRLRPIRAWGTYGRRPGQLVYPRAVALAPSGNVLVADPGNDRVTEYTARGRYVRTLGTNGRADGSLTAPVDVAANGRGEVAVADSARIAWFGLSDGRWLGRWAQGRSFQDSTATVMGPQSVAFAEDARVLVGTGGQIRRYGAGEARIVAGDASGKIRTGPVDAEFYGRTIVLDPAGSTWAIDRQGRPVAVRPDGTPGRALGEPEPLDRTVSDVAALPDGSIVTVEGGRDNVPDPADGTITRYDATTGRALRTWTLARPASAPEPAVPGGEAAVPASKPAGVVSDGAGGFWVSDRAHGRVVRFDAAGDLVATLGTPGTGPGQLAEPRGMTLACDGALLVADTGNNRIVRFPAAGVATGCGARPTPPTARAAPPRPAGLKVRTKHRAARPERVIARVATSCVRTCRIAAEGTASVSAGRFMRQMKLDARVSGRTVTLVASPSTVAALRSGLRKPRPYITAAAVITATTADGVVDTDTIVVRFRK